MPNARNIKITSAKITNFRYPRKIQKKCVVCFINRRMFSLKKQGQYTLGTVLILYFIFWLGYGILYRSLVALRSKILNPRSQTLALLALSGKLIPNLKTFFQNCMNFAPASHASTVFTRVHIDRELEISDRNADGLTQLEIQVSQNYLSSDAAIYSSTEVFYAAS